MEPTDYNALVIRAEQAEAQLAALVEVCTKITERPGAYDSGGSTWWNLHDQLAELIVGPLEDAAMAHDAAEQAEGARAERDRLRNILARPEFNRHRDVVLAIYKRLSEDLYAIETRHILAIEQEAGRLAVEAERERLRRLIAVGYPHVRTAATYPGVDAVMREDVLALLRDPNEHVDPDGSCESCRSIAAEENV
jgi:hypothetical protein